MHAHHVFLLKLIFATVVAAAPFKTALSGPILPSDYGAGVVIQSFDALGLSISTGTPVAIGSATYTTDTGQLQYSPSSLAACVSGGCLATWTDNGFIEVTLDSPAQKVGAFINGFSHLVAWPITAEFFDEKSSLIDSIIVVGLTPPPILNPPPAHQFLGYQASGNRIKTVRFNDAQNNGFSMSLDDLMIEATSVPEPSVFRMIALGVLFIVVAAKRRTARPVSFHR